MLRIKYLKWVEKQNPSTKLCNQNQIITLYKLFVYVYDFFKHRSFKNYILCCIAQRIQQKLFYLRFVIYFWFYILVSFSYCTQKIIPKINDSIIMGTQNILDLHSCIIGLEQLTKLSITKMFEDYFLPLNFIINCISLAVNLVLGMYAVFRPENNDTVQLIHNEQIPYFVRFFFQTIQLNFWVRRFFKIKQMGYNEEDQVNDQIDNSNLKQALTTGQIDYKEIEKALKPTAQFIKQQINLLNTLPKRNIFIDRKLRYVKINQDYKYFYFIISQIGNARFEAQRQQVEFKKLQQQLTYVFNEKNFPKLKFPRLRKIDWNNQETNRANDYQIWLQEITKNPIFMIKEVLEFLNIDQEKSAPFITYFNFSFKSFCSKIFLINYLKHKKTIQEDSSRGPSMVGYYQQEQRKNNAMIVQMIKTKMQFQIKIDRQIKSESDFGFEIVCMPQKKSKIKWKIRKQQEQMKNLNYKIQEQCKTTVPFYYQIISQLDKDNHNSQHKKQAYSQYLRKLLETNKYYCSSLFQFIRFNPITLQPETMGHNISIKNLVQDRKSHYMAQFESKGQHLQILRIDRLLEDTYKFVVKRRDLTISKTTDQLLELREGLVKIYKGVNYIPEIDFNDLHKIDAKEKIEQFLKMVQKLPKVQVCRHYQMFYENSANINL